MILKRPAFAILFCALPFLASAPARASLIVRLVPGLQTGEIGGPAFLEVMIDPDAGVYPMVGPGTTYAQMITGDFIPSRAAPAETGDSKSDMF